MIRIAIVDDNTFLQKTIQDKLSFFADVEVRMKAIHGQDIIEKLEKNHNLDLILMDIEMPICNGIDATKIIKTKYPQIKIIMLTVFDNDENIEYYVQYCSICGDVSKDYIEIIRIDNFVERIICTKCIEKLYKKVKLLKNETT